MTVVVFIVASTVLGWMIGSSKGKAGAGLALGLLACRSGSPPLLSFAGILSVAMAGLRLSAPGAKGFIIGKNHVTYSIVDSRERAFTRAYSSCNPDRTLKEKLLSSSRSLL